MQKRFSAVVALQLLEQYEEHHGDVEDELVSEEEDHYEENSDHSESGSVGPGTTWTRCWPATAAKEEH